MCVCVCVCVFEMLPCAILLSRVIYGTAVLAVLFLVLFAVSCSDVIT